MSSDRCPHCGYCPHCGRSNPVPTPFPQYPWTDPYPWGQYPITIWNGTDMNSSSAPKGYMSNG